MIICIMKAAEVKNGGRKTVRKQRRRKKDRVEQKWRMTIVRLKTFFKKIKKLQQGWIKINKK